MRTWPDPTIRQAEEDLHKVRQAVSRAETRLGHLLEDRRRQDRDVAEIRARGLEPWFRPRVAKPTPDDLHAEMRAHERVVRFWATDEEIETARREVAEAEGRLEEATQKFEAAKQNAQPLDDEAQQAKAKRGSGYQAIRRIKLGGRTYQPGEAIPKSALVDVGWVKLEGWLQGRHPTLRRV